MRKSFILLLNLLLISSSPAAETVGGSWLRAAKSSLTDILAAQQKAADDQDDDDQLEIFPLGEASLNAAYTVQYPFLRGEYFLPAIAHLAGSKVFAEVLDLIELEIINNGTTPLTVTVKARLQSYSEWAKETVTVPPQTTQVVALTPTFKPEISTLAEQLPGAIEWAIEDGNGKMLATKTEKITLAGRNDIINSDDEQERQFIAVFVTPSDPLIDELLGCARELGLSESFSGYQAADTAAVAQQIKAIYDLLSGLGVHYRSATSNFLHNADFFSQRVYYPRETLSSNGANCIDGTVLMAALLERLEMRPFIVMVPGHAFLAVALNENHNDDVLFVETTLIGTAAEDDADEDDDDDNDDTSSFLQAVASGQETFAKHAANDQAYLIDIAAARANGILPYPYYQKLLEKPLDLRRRLKIDP